jgi:hypothetical protein
MCIRRLTDKYSGLHSSVSGIFLSFSAEEYSSVIFLGTEEYNKIDECTMFSCSVQKVLSHKNATLHIFYKQHDYILQ